MPFYMVEFIPPLEFSDLESIPGVVLATDRHDAIEVVRECLEAEYDEELGLMVAKEIDEAEYWSWAKCPVHEDVGM